MVKDFEVLIQNSDTEEIRAKLYTAMDKEEVELRVKNEFPNYTILVIEEIK